jgi:uncharacterized membrane protein YgcG
MKQFKKTSLLSLMALAFVCAGALGVARADSRDLRVISARAGGVNLVTGDVKVRRVASADWVALSTQDELKSGDVVRTGPTGRVEILLNPGSYFRAGGGSEFSLVNTDLNDLRVELTRGSAVVEAIGYDDLKIGVAVPGSLVMIVRGGVYRINVPAAGPPEVAVTKGVAVVGTTVIKSGKFARLSPAGVEVTKLDKKWRDELDQWSRERGKELAKANERINRRALRTFLSTGSFDNIFGSLNGPSGFWYFNSSARCYTFLPYGLGWRSPYGYGYGLGVWRPGYDPSGGWVPRENRTWGNPGGGGTASNPGGGGGTWNNPGGGSGGSGGAGSNPGGGGRDFTPVRPTPVTPPSHVSPMERPMRERTIEPGMRRDQN